MIAIYIKSFLSGKYFEFFLQYTHLMMCWYNDKIWWWRKERERKKRMGKGFISDATSMLEHMCYFYHLSKNCLCNFWIKQNFCTDIFSNFFWLNIPQSLRKTFIMKSWFEFTREFVPPQKLPSAKSNESTVWLAF